MGWTVDQLPDLTQRSVVITGANSGIGFHTAKHLAGRGARVVLACRNRTAAEEAVRRIRATDPPGDLEIASLDLASMASVREFGEAWDGPLDVLINNAGVMAPPRRASTQDGFELQFGTNHLAHFVLTGLLLPTLAKADHGRVVTVASIAHRGGSAAVVDANTADDYDPQRTYADSKLANLLFALRLHHELRARGSAATSVAAHPGVCATGLFRDREGMGASPLMRTFAPVFVRAFTQSADAGARPVLYAATQAEPGSYTGPQRFRETRGPIGPARLSAEACDEQLARRLWQVSEELTGFRYTWP